MRRIGCCCFIDVSSVGTERPSRTGGHRVGHIMDMSFLTFPERNWFQRELLGPKKCNSVVFQYGSHVYELGTTLVREKLSLSGVLSSFFFVEGMTHCVLQITVCL